jgi:peptidoglycan/LPS O-acetylase OafA/YrhL
MKPAGHIEVLDGWRGISILLVLAAHLLPLGSRQWHINAATGILGMVIFFNLSGFLITSFLLREASIADFLRRRLFRIVPLAWLYIVVALLMSGVSLETWFAHLLFYANLPPVRLVQLTGHLWSVCIEMQFYLGIAILVSLCGARGLLLLPAFCLLFTLVRVTNEVHASGISWFRFDEILAGCTLALVCHGRMGTRIVQVLRSIPQWPLLLLLGVSCLGQGGWLNYFRPYLAAALIGSTVLNPLTVLSKALSARPLAYLAGISYALYVIHPMLAASWLGSGEVLEKYAKRPLLFLALFVLAHLSTYHYERKWIAFGKKLSGGTAIAAQR